MNQLVTLVAFAFLFYEAAGSRAARIAGGAAAVPGEVPSVVALLRHVPGSQVYSFRCAGALVYPHIVLSAAQCFSEMYSQPISWRVRVGSLLHDSDGAVVSVVTIRRHPEFDPVTLKNDIVMVNLGGPVNVINTTPALLPESLELPSSGAYAIIAGWGAIAATAPSTDVSSILNVANVRVADRDMCVTNLKMVGFSVQDNQFCTIGSGAGICHNDVGSPLYHGGRLVGVASIHVGCGFDVFPAVYTAVAPYLTWIQDNVLGL